MKLERIEAGGICDTGPNENCVSTAQAYSKKPAKKQRQGVISPLPGCSPDASRADIRTAEARWKRRAAAEGNFSSVEIVGLDMMGPVHLLGDDGGPRICIGYRPTATFCWIERRPWGAQWANANKFFIDREHVRSAVNWALKLARAIRKLAEAEQERRERLKAAILREKFGGEL